MVVCCIEKNQSNPNPNAEIPFFVNTNNLPAIFADLINDAEIESSCSYAEVDFTDWFDQWEEVKEAAILKLPFTAKIEKIVIIWW